LNQGAGTLQPSDNRRVVADVVYFLFVHLVWGDALPPVVDYDELGWGAAV
jgi:hypothetical protein